MNAVARLVALRQQAVSSQLILSASLEQLQPTSLSSFLTGIPPAAQRQFAHAYTASAEPQPLEENESALRLPPQPASQPNEQPFVALNFDDPQIAFRTKTTGELLLAHGVFTACQVRSFWHLLAYTKPHLQHERL
jgi:hypothetical protein